MEWRSKFLKNFSRQIFNTEGPAPSIMNPGTIFQCFDVMHERSKAVELKTSQLSCPVVRQSRTRAHGAGERSDDMWGHFGPLPPGPQALTNVDWLLQYCSPELPECCQANECFSASSFRSFPLAYSSLPLRPHINVDGICIHQSWYWH